MMASLKFALLLSIGLFGSALTSAVEIDVKKDQDDLKSDTQNGAVCQNCTEIFELFAVMFSNPDLQDKVMSEKQCDNRTASPAVSTMCKVKVKKMLPLAFNMIFASMVPRNVSTDKQTKMLSNGSAADNLFLSGNKDSLVCTFCKYVMGELLDMLPFDFDEQDVIDAMQKVCHIMPSFVEDKCTDLIDQYGKEIADAILQGGGASAICYAIRLCIFGWD